MRTGNRRSVLGLLIAVIVLVFSFSPQFRMVYNLPSQMHIIEGETKLITVNFPLTVAIQQDSKEKVVINDTKFRYAISHQVVFKPVHLGKAKVDFSLFGFIPIRSVEVNVLPAMKVLPGGHSIGVVLHSNGVLIVGFSPVQTGDRYNNPGKEAGINIGDIILSINGIPIKNDSQVARIIDDSGKHRKKVDMLIQRSKEHLSFVVVPILCSETQRYRIGLFVRDSAAGVGTLTFIDPQSNIFGALGHVITDSDTNQPIECADGKIVLATVSGIQSGRRGQPGEKIGTFIEEDHCLGIIAKNTPFGIYGDMQVLVRNPWFPETVPIGSMSQIQLGPAEMLTVIDGQTIEKFAIEIQKISMQSAPEGKGLVIKVIDPVLLQKTGGIVQGMSGSPILQNGKIVGSVTHVFVHDPTKGYGCFIDWMLMESGLLPKNTAHKMTRNLFSDSGHFCIYKGK